MSSPDTAQADASQLTIGDLAARTGKRPSSIRYYEQIGLLPLPARVSGRRVYDPGTIRTLAVIETAQRAGLALDEIKLLLDTSPGNPAAVEQNPAAVEQLRKAAERKLPAVMALIERSELVRRWLECAARCECADLDECPLFEDAALPAVPDKGRREPR